MARHDELLALPFVHEFLADLDAAIGLEVRKRYLSAVKAYPIDSPIEFLFAVLWQWLELLHRLEYPKEHWPYVLQPQYDVTTLDGRRYRFDFAIGYRAELADVEQLKLAVELDGHDFHERTKDQVNLRNIRDRDLAAIGWRVMHFSGSELNQRSLSVNVDVFLVARELYGSISGDAKNSQP